MSRLRAPSPNLGECKETGNWSNPKMIQQCNDCIKQENMFFCGDRCLSRYSFDTCSVNELVAKNKAQCITPCFQKGDPIVGGGCSDNFDCMEGQSCIIKTVPVYDGGKLRGSEKRGVCVNNVSHPMLMGVL